MLKILVIVGLVAAIHGNRKSTPGDISVVFKFVDNVSNSTFGKHYSEKQPHLFQAGYFISYIFLEMSCFVKFILVS